MPIPNEAPKGDPEREAIDSLRGYVYQIYQSALAWLDIKEDEFLYLEVSEDFATVARNALTAVQVKNSASPVTINSDDIITSINSFIELQEKNPDLNVSLRHLTTSLIGKEKKREHRIGETPTLLMWRKLAKAGDVSDIRRILDESKLSVKSKTYIADLSDTDFRNKLLKKINFDCGALDSKLLARLFSSRVSKLLLERGGVHSQTEGCTAKIMLFLLNLSTRKNRKERYVCRGDLENHLENATHLTINRAHFESQSRLMENALSASLATGTNAFASQSIKPSPVSEVPLPKALANRYEFIGPLLHSLENSGICWISGAAGMGKTITARVIAHQNEGAWANINLRGQSDEQVVLTLTEVANKLPSYGLQGLIVDDLNNSLGSSIMDNLHYLFHSATRSDVLLVVISSTPPTSEFLFASGLQENINITLTEFTEKNISEILEKIGVKQAAWAPYTLLVSGGGHPQLVIAFIQSMAVSGWNPKEFQTMESLILGSPAVNEVRKRTRERLLKDLSGEFRSLIERLSLKSGGFGRELAIDLGKLAPPIQDVGIILDNLTGSWIDQLEGDRFSLSPLLSDYATKTLSISEKKTIQSAIADSLTKGHSFDVIDINSALLAAWSSNNEAVIFKLCIAILTADYEKLELLEPFVSMFTMLKTDSKAYLNDGAISHMLRGTQLLLLNQWSDSPSKIEKVLRSFSEESESLQNEAKSSMLNLLVYSKLLLQNSKTGLGVNFIGVISKLDLLMQNKNGEILSEVLEGFEILLEEGINTLSFMFLNQVSQLTKIENLTIVFDFLDSSSEIRSRLLSSFDHEDFKIDMLVKGAWLNEHETNTIDSIAHSKIFSSLEKKAKNWNHTDLAVCCRKYQAIILDEYGDDKESALAVLDEGLAIYGQTNSELVREKAKVFYHSEDYEGSLALSKTLIESDAPLSEVEKAFLGRDAAISAEKQGDLKIARQYYLYGSNAANISQLPDMAPMGIGLLADAALTSWQDGDRLTCLKDFIVVLSELKKISPDDTLRTAHCHAISRHVLLWLYQDVTGKTMLLENGEETKIFPGCVSNPEPNPKIRDRYITPIEMAWYMLAMVENHVTFDVGITTNLNQYLPNGPIYEGQMLLSPDKIHKAMIILDVEYFIDALKDTISYYAFAKANDTHSSRAFDIKDVTYGTFPLATNEQQEELRDLTEKFVLLYFAMYIIKEDDTSLTEAILMLSAAKGFSIRPIILDIIQGRGSAKDFNTNFAKLVWIHASCPLLSSGVTPLQVFTFAIRILQMAKETGNYRLFSEMLLPWLEKKWIYIHQNQRFMLIHSSLYEATIRATIEKKDVSSSIKIVELLSAILPTLEISNQIELGQFLSALPKY